MSLFRKLISWLLRPQAPPAKKRKRSSSRRSKRGTSTRSATFTIEAAADPTIVINMRFPSLRSAESPAHLQQIARQSAACWIPPNQAVRVHDLTLPDGMVYVGQRMPGLITLGGETDPALINPHLPIDRRVADYQGAGLCYWPSYAELPPASRTAYLEWLAAGRPGGANIGYVFLFFYGIERRVLVDLHHLPEARAELPRLIEEVERLLSLYQEDYSFRSYATNFLGVARLMQGTGGDADITLPMKRSGTEIPLVTQVAIATAVRQGQPIPGDWAFSWLMTHPETRLRTPAIRCADEFRQLFLLRYADTWGEGLKVRPNKTPLRVQYQAASAALRGGIELDVGDLPDVSRLVAPVRRLQELAETACDDLADYSRWVGRTNDRESIAAVSRLPAELVDLGHGVSTAFQAWLDEQLGDADSAVIDTETIRTRWLENTSTRQARRDSIVFANFLARLGYGIEPDARYGGPNLARTEHAVIFRLSQASIDAPTDPDQAYQAATLLLHLAAAVATADGVVTTHEEDRLEQHLESALNLPPGQRTRLRAHWRWLLASTPGMAGLKQRCAALSEADRHQIGQFLIAVAGADGRIEPAELRSIAKIYRLLGLNPDDVYRDVHELAAAPRPAAEPVMIVPPDTTDHSYAIPAPQPSASAGTITLAPERISAIMAETRAVAAVLESVFSDDVPDQPDGGVPPTPADEPAHSVAGLDEAHSRLVRDLAKQPLWPRSEFDALVEQLGLLPAGAIETINEAAFELADEPFLEGEDPLEVNMYLVEEWSQWLA